MSRPHKQHTKDPFDVWHRWSRGLQDNGRQRGICRSPHSTGSIASTCVVVRSRLFPSSSARHHLVIMMSCCHRRHHLVTIPSPFLVTHPLRVVRVSRVVPIPSQTPPLGQSTHNRVSVSESSCPNVPTGHWQFVLLTSDHRMRVLSSPVLSETCYLSQGASLALIETGCRSNVVALTDLATRAKPICQ